MQPAKQQSEGNSQLLYHRDGNDNYATQLVYRQNADLQAVFLVIFTSGFCDNPLR